MARWALIRNGIVSQVVEQATKPPLGDWRDITGQAIGPDFVLAGEVFSVPTKSYARIRTEAFWERFTSVELVRYDVAMQHDPAATDDAKKDAAKLRIFKADAAQAGYRRLGANKVTTLVNSLEPAIIDAGRAAEILTTPVTAAEAYT